MATVYLAEDLKHHRQVAIKVLLPELAASLGNERFQREIDLAARLQHPHILSVYDSGEVEGQLWFSMPYVEGESLRDRLNRERQLPVDDAISIAQEAARALEYAHQHGVIHRDIKPENIMLTKDGSTLVADFGIARSLASDAQLTGTGVSIGTPAYMSPEQASGDRQLDARTDIFSLGAVLYEMLAGEAPWTGATAQVIIAKRFSEPAPSVRRIRSTVPVAVDQALQRAMAAAPADRPASAGQFAQELKRASATTTSATIALPAATRPSRAPLFAAAAAILVIALSAVGWKVLGGERGGGNREVAANEPLRIAVLPFDNLGDTSDAYFADGMTEAVRSKLTQIKGLQVIARASSDVYRNSTKTQREIAQELGVQYLLVGTIRWAKAKDGTSRVQVTPELVELGDGNAHSRWAKPFDQPLTEVFEVQGEIATRLATELDVAIGASTAQELAERPTKDLLAYQDYLRGEAITGLDPASLRERFEWMHRAVRRDSTFGLAWARLAVATVNLLTQSVVPLTRDSLEAVQQRAMLKARKLAPHSVETYAAELAIMAIDEDLAGMDRIGREALARYPNVALIRRAVGGVQVRTGRGEEAIANYRLSVQLDPLSVSGNRGLSHGLFFFGEPQELLTVSLRTLDLNPADFDAIHTAMEAYIGVHDLAGARRVLQQVPSTVDRPLLYHYIAVYDDMFWLLTPGQQDTVLTLPLGTLDDDRGSWALMKSQIYRQRKQEALARVWADSAIRGFSADGTPTSSQTLVLRSIAQAIAGRRQEALADQRQALEKSSRPSANTVEREYVRTTALRTQLYLGDLDGVLTTLEQWGRRPGYVWPGRLRLDPDFAPLQGNPRFEKLMADR